MDLRVGVALAGGVKAVTVLPAAILLDLAILDYSVSLLPLLSVAPPLLLGLILL